MKVLMKPGTGLLQARYLLMGLVAALLAGFGLIADEVGEGDTLDFDKAVLAALREPGDMQNPIGPAWVEEAARDITALGGVAFLTLLVTVKSAISSGEMRPVASSRLRTNSSQSA